MEELGQLDLDCRSKCERFRKTKALPSDLVRRWRKMLVAKCQAVNRFRRSANCFGATASGPDNLCFLCGRSLVKAHILQPSQA